MNNTILGTALILFVFIEEVIYRTPMKKGICVIIDGLIHERCHCSNVNSCKPRCNTDHYCKGFANGRFGSGNTTSSYCSYATTSNCLDGCTKLNEGNLGKLVPDSEMYTPIYSGCYIKQTSNNS